MPEELLKEPLILISYDLRGNTREKTWLKTNQPKISSTRKPHKNKLYAYSITKNSGIFQFNSLGA